VHPEFCLGFEEYIEMHSSLMMVSWSGCTQLSKDSKIPAIGIHVSYFLWYFCPIVQIVRVFFPKVQKVRKLVIMAKNVLLCNV
jgi:hypothetical protein